jgi:UDP-N-acetyl-2-amino-2-deoxyglucuronate dehydrogenase
VLLPNSTIWDTRIQAVDALLTASANGRNEVYYLATVCQVGLEPLLISVSPNPEYPICETMRRAGYFGVHFMSRAQGPLVEACKRLDRGQPDKLAILGLDHTVSENGVPLLTRCLHSLECKVERAWDSGDHRTFVGEVVGRRAGVIEGEPVPHRFGGVQPRGRRVLKRWLCATGLYDLLMLAKGSARQTQSIAEGTGKYVGEPEIWEDRERSSDRPVSARLAPDPPGICLVGCGWWGGVHANNLLGLGSRIRRYFASRNPARAKDFAARFGGEDVFTEMSAALADRRVDAVVLALPHHLHAPAASEALAAGKHVLVEKPLAIDVAEGERLVELAERSGVRLAVAEQYRLSPLVQKAREALEAGLLGRISIVNAGAAATYRPTQAWKRTHATMGGGVFLDLGIHYVDVLRYLFGEPLSLWAAQPAQVDASLEWEDSAVASLRFPDGPVATVSVSWSAHRSPDVPNLEIVGEKGSLGLWFSKPYLVHSSPLPPSHWAQRLKRTLPWRVSRRVGKLMPRELEQRLPVEPGDLIGSRAVIEDFVSAITGGHAPAVSGADGLRDLRIVMAAYESIESGVALSIDS